MDEEALQQSVDGQDVLSAISDQMHELDTAGPDIHVLSLGALNNVLDLGEPCSTAPVSAKGHLADYSFSSVSLLFAFEHERLVCVKAALPATQETFSLHGHVDDWCLQSGSELKEYLQYAMQTVKSAVSSAHPKLAEGLSQSAPEASAVPLVPVVAQAGKVKLLNARVLALQSDSLRTDDMSC